MVEKEYLNLSSEFSQALASLRTLNIEQISYIEGYIAGAKGAAKENAEKRLEERRGKEDEKSLDR